MQTLAALLRPPPREYGSPPRWREPIGGKPQPVARCEAATAATTSAAPRIDQAFVKLC